MQLIKTGSWYAVPSKSTPYFQKGFVQAFPAPRLSPHVTSPGVSLSTPSEKRIGNLVKDLYYGAVTPPSNASSASRRVAYVVTFTASRANPWSSVNVGISADLRAVRIAGLTYQLPFNITAQFRQVLKVAKPTKREREPQASLDPEWQLLLASLILLGIFIFDSLGRRRAARMQVTEDDRRDPTVGALLLVIGCAFLVLSLATWKHTVVPAAIAAFVVLLGLGRLLGENRLTYYLTLVPIAVACGEYLSK
jgi:hypothetical protein